MRTHDGPHGGTNFDEACYGCVLKDKDISLAADALGTRRPGGPPKMRPVTQPSWEAGVSGETRVDGAFMPYLDSNLDPIGVKEYADKRGHYDAARHDQLHDPNYGKGTPT